MLGSDAHLPQLFVCVLLYTRGFRGLLFHAFFQAFGTYSMLEAGMFLCSRPFWCFGVTLVRSDQSRTTCSVAGAMQAIRVLVNVVMCTEAMPTHIR